MNERDRILMQDIVAYGQEAVTLLGNRTGAALAEERVVYLAVCRLAEIVGEASSKVTAETRAKHPGAPWREAADMRNILAHDYGRIDYDIIASTVRRDFPGLIAQVTKILEDETP